MSVYLLDDDDPRFPPARLASPDEDGILAAAVKKGQEMDWKELLG